MKCSSESEAGVGHTNKCVTKQVHRHAVFLQGSGLVIWVSMNIARQLQCDFVMSVQPVHLGLTMMVVEV